MSGVTGYYGYKGAKKQAEVATQAQDLTEAARQESLGYVDDEGIMSALATFFPGFFDEGATDDSLGGLMTQALRDYFNDPGISPAGYERSQEINEQRLNADLQGITGGLAGSGVDPNSELGQTLALSARRNATSVANEANRDFTLAEETIRDQRIASAMQGVANIIGQIMGTQVARAGIVQGNPVPPAQIPNVYEPAINALGADQAALGSYMNQMQQGYGNFTQPAPSNPGGPAPGGVGTTGTP